MTLAAIVSDTARDWLALVVSVATFVLVVLSVRS